MLRTYAVTLGDGGMVRGMVRYTGVNAPYGRLCVSPNANDRTKKERGASIFSSL
ncbi:hypothetical protein [Floridanema aerugineum]|uniref:Uncharacterized protein n=1 Tax=Floridaenema aerugineum BLCC-F46 TaxID=3153654 RepID=A0ABV4X212_9CYAN